ncbi:BnaC09g12220D [Brassica napus]|nr:BnaC09g12220D [Brassica napus]
MLLLDPKAVVTATMVLERPDALDGSLRIIQIKLLRPSDSSCSDMHIHSFVMKGLAPDNSEPLLRWSHC